MGTTTTVILNDRFYRLFIPTGIGADCPLVIALHPGLTDAEDWETRLGLNDVSEAAATPFMIAYPDGSGFFTQDSSFVATWNSGLVNAEKVISGKAAGVSVLLDQNDLDFLRRMRYHILNTQDVDPTKVYLTGYSNGGEIAYSWLSLYPDEMVAATIFASALMIDGNNCSDTINLPITHVYGTLDSVIPYTGSTPANLLTILFSGTLPSLADFSEFLAERGADFTFYRLPGATHTFDSINTFLTLYYSKTMATLIGDMVV